MDAAVIVLSHDIEATRRAASYMSRLIGQCTHPTTLVVPDELGEVTPEELEAIRGMWGLTADQVITGVSRIQGINDAISAAIGIHAANLVHVFDSRMMVSSNWRAEASLSRVMFAAVGPVGPQLTGSQLVKPPVEDFVDACTFLAGRFAGKLAPADVLDPEAFSVSSKFWTEVGSFDAELVDLAWALSDWCVRVRDAGSRVVAGLASYAHQVGRRLSPWEDRTAAGRLAYYGKHAGTTSRAADVAGVVLCQPQNRHQWSLIRATLASAAQVCDRLVLALVDQPKAFLQADGPELRGKEGRILENPDPFKACDELEAFLSKTLPVPVKVGMIPPGWTSPAELEATAAKVAADQGATWALWLREGDLCNGWDRPELHRLCSHPDPAVCAYQVGIRYSWDSRRLLREDPPYGDNGSLRDDVGGANDLRLFRLGATRKATDGARVANLRLLNIGIEDHRYRRPGSEDGAMRIVRQPDGLTIGAHMLAYEGENPEGIARWLDWTFGLVRHWVIGWTSGSVTLEHAQVATTFGAELLPVHGDEDRWDFGGWRNRALDWMAKEFPSLGWHLFVDPDEWPAHPVHDLMAWRRMVEQSDRYAWMQAFENHRAGGDTSESQAVRIWRTGHGLRFDGRVHETIGDTLLAPKQAAAKDGRKYEIGTSPITIFNRGTAELGTSHEKLALYARLIREELAERPDSSRHWVLLSYQYAADGHLHEAITCLERAIAVASPTAYLPWYDLGLLHLGHARRGLTQALRRIPESHPKHAATADLVRMLERVADPVEPDPDAEVPELPPFPEELEAW